MDIQQGSAPPALSEFKPNIYPLMYWALTFGATAAILLFLLSIIARYINYFWPLIFLAGLGWGGYRNYRKQKRDWQARSGVAAVAGSPVDEFKQAVRDITSASRDLMAEQAAEAPLNITSEEPAVPERPRDADTTPPVPPAPPQPQA